MTKFKPCVRRHRFTLIEIVVVIVILVSLASIATPLYMNYIKKANVAKAQTEIKNIEQAVNDYKLELGKYPSSLQCLVTNADGEEKWNGPYLKPKVPQDPWQHDYIYICPGEHNTKEFDLCTYGADGQAGGTGENADITNWPEE